MSRDRTGQNMETSYARVVGGVNSNKNEVTHEKNDKVGLEVGKIGAAENCLEVQLELDSDKQIKVDQKLGKKILELLGDRRGDAIGFGTQGNVVEYWLKSDVDIEDFKIAFSFWGT